MLAGARDFLTMPVSAEEIGRSIVSVLESEERRQMRLRGQTAAWGPQGSVITVFGAKGGVGKTTVAVNLAAALVQETAQSVVLVDGDNGFGDVCGMLDIAAGAQRRRPGARPGEGDAGHAAQVPDAALERAQRAGGARRRRWPGAASRPTISAR